jgi:hypothetical protein
MLTRWNGWIFGWMGRWWRLMARERLGERDEKEII